MAEAYFHNYPLIYYDQLDGRFHNNRGKILTAEEWKDYLWHERRIDVRDSTTRKFYRSSEVGDTLRTTIAENLMRKYRTIKEIKATDGKYDRYVMNITDDVSRYDEKNNKVYLDRVMMSLLLDSFQRASIEKYPQVRIALYTEALVKGDLREPDMSTKPIGSVTLKEYYKNYGESLSAVDDFVSDISSIESASGYGMYFFGIPFIHLVVKGWGG